ncbi:MULTISPECIES: GNAT family acetyltransferase [unclassified Flavobacterium]|uniref:GNAT family acetyltransferase n=1 Tax=unclassified Flavobacterium TaxID=196869 RepID=UPI000F82908C|nr:MULTISPECIES: GNAT family acetyltransferase [unclassified Flavobacterium]RTY76749.1 GNAT family acetyltransferase [Flavobacterium sp. LS1R10]RTY86897.1 GNAT family acetyltransferase [Flavobacterium sp. RSP15]
MTESIQFETAKMSDIDGVLVLQELYLVVNLSEEEKISGFVTTPFSILQLTEVIQKSELFIAKKNNKIIAYIFAGSWEFFQQWPIFNYMSSLFPELHFLDFKITTTNSFQYGPICIHKEYRGRGLIKPLFEFMRTHMTQKYALGLTFINKINIPSMKAHTEKLKWTIIGDFQFNNNDYSILAYNMNQPVSKTI